jgi:hypothetical protein
MGQWNLDHGPESDGVGFSWTEFPSNCSRFAFFDDDLICAHTWSIAALCGCWGLEFRLGTPGKPQEMQHEALRLLRSLSCPFAACMKECPDDGRMDPRSYARYSLWCAISDGESQASTKRRIPWQRQATVHARFVGETLSVLDDEARDMAREKQLLASVIGHML